MEPVTISPYPEPAQSFSYHSACFFKMHLILSSHHVSISTKWPAYDMLQLKLCQNFLHHTTSLIRLLIITEHISSSLCAS